VAWLFVWKTSVVANRRAPKRDEYWDERKI
jgi:hypothetical protein